MDFGIASVAAITVICYLIGQVVKASGVDNKWIPIACGVSGATQHVSGMTGSGYVVAINKDEDAPIFDVADVGIVGDVMKVLPAMIEEIRKRKAE